MELSIYKDFSNLYSKDTELILNQLGYTVNGAKYFTVLRPRAIEFNIIKLAQQDGVCLSDVVYTGILSPSYGGDLGEGFYGDFSPVKEEGIYRIQIAETISDMIVVSDNQYIYTLKTIFNYYRSQRCGDSITGWHSPCHLKPARDSRTGELKDVSGGWHQSGDTRKWLFGTTPGMFGLFALENCSTKMPWMKSAVRDEMKWGNLYFHKMIREDGGLMDYVSIPNNWDDECERMLMSEDTSFMTFFNMIAAQCMAAEVFAEDDSKYSGDCLEKAKTLYEYTNSPAMPDYYKPTPFLFHESLDKMFPKSYRGSSLYYGDKLFALVMLYNASGEKTYLDDAVETANEYCTFQIHGDPEDDIAAGCFYTDKEKTVLDAGYEAGNMGLIGLCILIKLLPGHPDCGEWTKTVSTAAKQAVLSSKRNPYGLTASYWYSEPAPDRRKGGSVYYKYFYADDKINIGVNYEILCKSVFLMRAAGIVDFADDCKAAAQRQVDWVLGCNPFKLSTCEGVGIVHRQQLINVGEFLPPVPQIPGAVQTGIGCLEGTDSPQFGLDVSHEYDMPCTSLLMWAITELLNGADSLR